MKATDLMIGDWVYRKRGYDNELIPCQIIATNRKGCTVEFNNGSSWSGEWIGDIEPIPLTKEILENNGFEWAGDSQLSITVDGVLTTLLWWNKNTFYFGMYRHNKNTPAENIGINITTVHELQHALKLCGINIEIEL